MTYEEVLNRAKLISSYVSSLSTVFDWVTKLKFDYTNLQLILILLILTLRKTHFHASNSSLPRCLCFFFDSWVDSSSVNMISLKFSKSLWISLLVCERYIFIPNLIFKQSVSRLEIHAWIVNDHVGTELFANKTYCVCQTKTC